MLIEHEPQKEKKKETIEIPQCNIDHAYARISAWEKNPQTGVRLRMNYSPDGKELFVMFSFQHTSGPTKAVPVELWDKEFFESFRLAEKMYLDFSRKADSIANELNIG